MTQVAFRAPQELAARVEQLANYHGRSPSAELRLALAVHNARATLRFLDTTEGKTGSDREQTRGKVEADLRRLEAEAYQPRPALPLETVK